jgi:exonuclease III
MSRLRIATWNIAGGRKMRSQEVFDYEDRDLEYFADQFKALNLDIICIQECEYLETDHIAEKLAKLLGIPCVFETLMHQSHISPGYTISTVILSKSPLIKAQAIKQPYPDFEVTLPNGQPAQKHTKYLQVAEYDGLCVANTQTQPLEFLGTPYESERGRGFAKILSKLFIEELHRPLVFAGDFCADLHTTHVSKIYKEACESFELKDVLPPGQTKPNNKGRADAIFISPELKKIDSGIVQTETDHFLCWAEIEYAK